MLSESKAEKIGRTSGELVADAEVAIHLAQKHPTTTAAAEVATGKFGFHIEATGSCIPNVAG